MARKPMAKRTDIVNLVLVTIAADEINWTVLDLRGKIPAERLEIQGAIMHLHNGGMLSRIKRENATYWRITEKGIQRANRVIREKYP